MQVQFSGDFASLATFTTKVQGVPSVLQTVNEQLAEESIELIHDGFDKSEDPYGNPWEPLKLRDGRPLEDTGATKASWSRRYATREGFSVDSHKETTLFHQKGTGLFGPRRQPIVPVRARALKLPGGIFRKSVAGEPPRPMVPDHGLPSRWRDRFNDTAREVLLAHFG